MLIGWLPPAVLATGYLLTSGDESARTFFPDYGFHARFLVAVPLLIFAEADCFPRLGKIASHFAETGLVAGTDIDRLHAAVSSTRRLLDSIIDEVVTIVLAYLVVLIVAVYVPPGFLEAWHRDASGLRLSPAGWWHTLVSVPLLLVLMLGWLWRLALWARFLFLMSRLDLQLIAGHPDRVGGLRFVSTSLLGFRLISPALGAIVAGSVANGEMHRGKQPIDFKNLVIGLVVFLLVLFAGPLTVFLKKLRQTKIRGTLEYGALAAAVGTQFEAKWLHQKSVDGASLEVPDFSATTDLYSVAANVYAMREVPFTLRDVIGPIVISATFPLLPAALLAIPMKVIIQAVAKLLF